MALVIGIGGLFTDQGLVSVGTVAAFVLYLTNLFDPVQQLSQQYNVVQSAGAALQKIFELLDVEPSIGGAPRRGRAPAHGRGRAARRVVRVRRRSRRAARRDAHHRARRAHRAGRPDRRRQVDPGQAGGALLRPARGTVSFGGVDLRDATMHSLRERIVVVPQEGFMFAGTVRDNIRVGRPDATDAEVEAAVDALGLRDRFESLPGGLDTEVRERGSRLSGGERQLVSFARAALADPTVLVLDEATSNLDPGTEQHRRARARASSPRTAPSWWSRTGCRPRRAPIGSRSSTAVWLAELGTHDELLALGGRYARLFASWSAAASG